jgi:hypothetical protein
MPSYQWVTGETITANKLNTREIDVLVVGGGGGSGTAISQPAPALTNNTAGGGGGQVVFKKLLPNISDSFSITIGAGGAAGGNFPTLNGSSGNSTTFGPLTAAGGGESLGSPSTLKGGDSGGAPSAGYAGAYNLTFPNRQANGGGGGAAGPGSVPGGGGGFLTDLSGSESIYGGGGNGSSVPGGFPAAADGAANTGFGGDGVFRTSAPTTQVTLGKSGGSGVVIVAYDGPTKATGGTITTANGRTIHTFTSGPATFTWTG